MVFNFSVQHLFMYPVEKVLKAYLKKHESSDNVYKVEIISSIREDEFTILKRKVMMENYFPNLMRRVQILKRKFVTLEEDIWSRADEKQHWIRIVDTTWENVVIAHIIYLSPFENNREWSFWERETAVDLSSFGVLGYMLELYLHKHLKNETQKELNIMKKILAANDSL